MKSCIQGGNTIATLPCFNSASLQTLRFFSSRTLVNPIGSKKPVGRVWPGKSRATSIEGVILTALVLDILNPSAERTKLKAAMMMENIFFVGFNFEVSIEEVEHYFHDSSVA